MISENNIFLLLLSLFFSCLQNERIWLYFIAFFFTFNLFPFFSVLFLFFFHRVLCKVDFLNILFNYRNLIVDWITWICLQVVILLYVYICECFYCFSFVIIISLANFLFFSKKEVINSAHSWWEIPNSTFVLGCSILFP